MLIGKRIRLRPILKSDAEVLNNWKNNYEIFKFLGGGYDPQSLDDFHNHIDSLIFNSGNNKRFIICLNEKSIGMIGIYGINQRNGTCELGMYIGEKEHWGKGYGQESLKLIENLIVNNYNLRKIKLLVVSKNKSAVKFYERMNYRHVGKYLNDRFIDGEYEDVSIMEKIF